MKRQILFPLLFIILSILMSLIGVIIFASAYAGSLEANWLTLIIFMICYWPMFLFGALGFQVGLDSYFLNAVGWGILGFVISLFIKKKPSDEVKGERINNLLPIARIGYIIYAVLAGVFIVLKIIKTLTMINKQMGQHDMPIESYVPLISFGIIGLVLIILISILVYFLFKQTHRTVCIILSVILLAAFPFGTILGIITILALTRSDIKKQFTS